jgi:hypothetical protein
MSHEFELSIATIIQRHQDHDVLNIRQEVMWPDGSSVGLHPVRQHAADSLLLRAVHTEGHWVLFRLDAIAPEIAEDLRLAQPRDRPGCVLYGLRLRYQTAAAFLADVASFHALRWPGSPRAAQPCSPVAGKAAGAHLATA